MPCSDSIINMSGGGILHHRNNVTPHSRRSGSRRSGSHRGEVLYIPMVKLSYERKIQMHVQMVLYCFYCWSGDWHVPLALWNYIKFYNDQFTQMVFFFSLAYRLSIAFLLALVDRDNRLEIQLDGLFL